LQIEQLAVALLVSAVVHAVAYWLAAVLYARFDELDAGCEAEKLGSISCEQVACLCKDAKHRLQVAWFRSSLLTLLSLLMMCFMHLQRREALCTGGVVRNGQF
jgi:hypothetical protein